MSEKADSDDEIVPVTKTIAAPARDPAMNTTWTNLQRRNSQLSNDDSYSAKRADIRTFKISNVKAVKEESDFSDDAEEQDREEVYRAIPKAYGEENMP